MEWIEQKAYSYGETTGKDVEENSLKTRLLTAPDVERILNINKGAAYQLIQQGKIPCVRINRSVRVRSEDLDDFISGHIEK